VYLNTSPVVVAPPTGPDTDNLGVAPPEQGGPELPSLRTTAFRCAGMSVGLSCSPARHQRVLARTGEDTTFHTARPGMRRVPDAAGMSISTRRNSHDPYSAGMARSQARWTRGPLRHRTDRTGDGERLPRRVQPRRLAAARRRD